MLIVTLYVHFYCVDGNILIVLALIFPTKLLAFSLFGTMALYLIKYLIINSLRIVHLLWSNLLLV